MGFNHSGVSRSVRVFSFIREVPKVEENRISATRRWWEETRMMSIVLLKTKQRTTQRMF